MRHPMIDVGHLHRLDALVPQLVDLAADGEAPVGGPRGLLHDETGDSVIGGAGQQHHNRGPYPVGDPHLGAVDDPLVTVGDGPAADVLRVAAGIGFRQRERRPQRAVHHAGQEPLTLLVGAEAADHGDGQLVRVEDPGERHPPPRQFLHDAGRRSPHRDRGRRRTGRWWAPNRPKSHIRAKHGLRKLISALELARCRHHIAVHPGGDGCDQLVGQFPGRCPRPDATAPHCSGAAGGLLSARDTTAPSR